MLPGMNMPPESSLFTILPDQKAKYEAQFKNICPAGDFVNGPQARELMLKSGLPPPVLAHIWNLADVDADGRMDINEFCIALHLIALKMKGIELPKTLPQSLKVLVEPPPFAAFNTEPKVNNAPAMAKSSTTPILSPSNSIHARMANMDLGGAAAAAGKAGTAPSPTNISTGGAEWAIPQQTKLKYTQMFNQHDRSRTGFLTGIQARNILLESKLPQAILAQIWNLADVDTDGRLTCEEFVLAMHLVDKAKRQETLPAKLPPDLIPPSYRRGSGTLSHASSLDDTSEHNDISTASKNSFEDKRRENYEKGQAELDRRRAALLEQQRREKEERERKEREENARKEKERLEAERRRQEEIELQRQKLREQELEREEQKRRQQEVRELARKEMERQRQRELEQARRSELLTQRSRLMDEIHKLKSRRKVLTIEHEQMDKKLAESKTIVAASREKVVKLKSEIDGMRNKRDEALARQSQIKVQMKSLTEKQLFVEQEKVRLAAQLKSLIANTSNGVNPDQQLTSFASILQAKQSQINQLRSQLERTEKEFQAKKDDVFNNKQELEKLKRNFRDKRAQAMKFLEKIEEKRVEAEKVRDGKAQSKFAADSDVAWGAEVPTNFEWPSGEKEKKVAVCQPTLSGQTIRTKFKYRCVFEFEARNEDEITIKPGDIILVDTSACSEEGWLSGEINGKIGWFPKDYAVLDEEGVGMPEQPVQSASTAAAITEAQALGTETGLVQEARALYDWTSEEAGHLSFFKDDIIRITQHQDSWCFGELLDRTTGQVTASGWFPESYVQIGAVAGGGGDQVRGDDSQQYYVGLYAFETVEPGDLAFDVNELIKVEKREGEWWTGVIIDRQTGQEDPNRRGIFPCNFVGPANPDELPAALKDSQAAPATAADSGTTNASKPALTKKESIAPAKAAHQPLDRKESTDPTDSPKPTKKGKSKKQQEIVQAVAAYTATGPEQLSLEVGQLIQVRKKTATGWWEGELQAKGKKKQIGWFPASYVKPLGAAGPVATTGTAATTVVTGTTSIATDAKSVADEPEIEKVVALYPFSAQRTDEISFNKDDVIRVLSKSDPTWWRGHNIRTGEIGLFPSNHVQVMTATNGGPDSNIVAYHHDDDDDYYYSDDSFEDDDDSDLGRNHTRNDGPPLDDDDDDSFEDDDDDNDYDDEDGGGGGSNSMGSFVRSDPRLVNVRIFDQSQISSTDDGGGTGGQVQRDQSVYELVQSEHAYVTDLFFIMENYVDRIKRDRMLPVKDFDLIFGQIPSIYDANLDFLSDLSQRIKNSPELRFCDLLNQHLEKMWPRYQEYCSKQVFASARLLNRIETDAKFDEYLRSITRETGTYLPLSSYLIKPMQRITKYPLLIEKIHKLTPASHPDYDDCERALKRAKKFCQDINDACRKTENFDRLHWIQKMVTVPAKAAMGRPIDFNSETRFMGPRTLRRAGIVVKPQSHKTLVAFLFNDFFLLVKPDKKTLKLLPGQNFFHNTAALHCHYTAYRCPVPLDKIQICDPVGFETQLDPSTFRLFNKAENRFITLKAASVADQNQWLNEIAAAAKHYNEIREARIRQRPVPVPSLPVGHIFVTVVELVNLYSYGSDSLDLQCELAIGTDWDNLTTAKYRTPIVNCNKNDSQTKKTKRNDSLSSTMSFSKSRFHGSLLSKPELKGPYRANWNSSTKFLVHDMTSPDTQLLIRCYDRPPFEPRRCLGERRFPLCSLAETSRHIGGTVTKCEDLDPVAADPTTAAARVVHSRPTLLFHYNLLPYN